MRELKTAIAAGVVALEIRLCRRQSPAARRPGRASGRFGRGPSCWHTSTSAPRSNRDCCRSAPSLPRASSASASRTGPDARQPPFGFPNARKNAVICCTLPDSASALVLTCINQSKDDGGGTGGRQLWSIQTARPVRCAPSRICRWPPAVGGER